MSSDKILVEVADDVGRLTFNQPHKHNALDSGMWRGISSAVAELAADDRVRVIVVTGAGERAFSAGADISEFEQVRASPDTIAEYDAAASKAEADLARVPKPTVAMIRGYCVGGGLGIALCCDLRVAGDDARFAIPAARLGLAYDWSEVLPLVKTVGPAFAREILFTGRQFSAEEALAMGLVNRVVPASDLDASVASWVRGIAENAPLSVRAAKATIAAAVEDPGDRDLAALRDLVEACYGSEDYAEGRKAFMEKRKPRFKGC